MEKQEFVNAAKTAKENPLTFEVPTEKEIKDVKKGTYLKVCAEPERFWVRVETVNEDGTYVGRIEQSDMVCSDKHGYNHDDDVVVLAENIYSIYNE
jgi:hypothetical protein